MEYDSVAKTLAFGKNNSALTIAYHDVVRPTKDLYPMVIFTRRYNTTKVSPPGAVVVSLVPRLIAGGGGGGGGSVCEMSLGTRLSYSVNYM